jgi:hypothetical protein
MFERLSGAEPGVVDHDDGKLPLAEPTTETKQISAKAVHNVI